ncbi:hypothetical protein [Algimonas porphyrae]
MAQQPLLDMLSRIDRALLAEIEILQEGRFTELHNVQIETAEAMKGLDEVRLNLKLPGTDSVAIERAMAGIRSRAERARGLLASALNGARDARARLDGLHAAEHQVGAYTANGLPVALKNFASPYNKTL